MKRYEEIIAKERAADEALDALKKEIVAAVAAGKPIEGVSPNEGSSIRSATVNFSTIAGNGFNLSAKAYMQQSQAEAVNRRLASATRTYEVVDRLREMVLSGRINFGNGDAIALNAATISALQTFVD